MTTTPFECSERNPSQEWITLFIQLKGEPNFNLSPGSPGT
jgi:hypothetical protein